MSLCKIVLFGFVIVVSAVWCPVRADDEGQHTLEKSVVKVNSVRQDFDYITPWKQRPMGRGVGSGFVIEGNRILTNAHNVSNCKYLEIKKQNQAKRYLAKAVFIAHDCDLAIITVTNESFFDDTIPLELGTLPKVNSTVQTYGFPVGGKQVSVTEGVVSRIQMDVYAHSRADSHLVIQTDAAINPGNSGGPVLQGEKVVGVAFQGLREAENIGYMIPTTVIRHFLADIEDGKYDGFGSVGFTFFPGIHNKSYAEYLELPADEQGIVVLSTMMHSSTESLLESGDVITRVEDYDIDNDGMIKIHGLTLHMAEAIEQKLLGETVELTFYRGGEEKKATAEVALNRPVLAYRREFDAQPRYVVYAGLTFVPMSRNFLESWGPKWVTDIPHYLRYLFTDSDYLNEDRERKEYVVLSEILPDEVTSYTYGYKNKVVETVNGVDIWSLGDLPGAFGGSNDGFCTIKFMSSDTPLVIDNTKAAARHVEILKKYNIPQESNLKGQL